MKLLGSLLPMSKIGPQAEWAATRFLERWDAPHEIDGQPVAEDIDDRTPHFWRDRFGKRLAGQASPNTLIYGAPSMATPVVIGLIPLLAMLTAILAALIGPTPALVLGGLAISAVTASLVIAEGWAMALGCALVGAVIPLTATVGMAAFHLHFNVNVNAIGNSMIVTALVVAGGIFLLAMLLTGSIDRARVALLYLLSFGLVLGAVQVFAHFLPDWMAPGVWFFLGAGLPWAWTHLSWKSYHDRLFVQDVKASAESVGQSGASHVLARRQQAENVMRDKSPVLTLGTATGTFTAQGDGFAPDKGKKLCMSAKDSSMNVAVFGRLGTRKSSFFRAWISQWVKEKIGGFLALDEKDLPAELRGLVGYTLIEPGVKYAPLQGLNPTETAVAIFGAGKAAEKDDASSFFYVSAYTMWLQGAVIVQALMDVERGKMKAGKLAELNDEPLSAAIEQELEQARRIRWTFASIRTVIAHGIRGDQAITGILNSLSEHRRENEGEQFMLEAAIDYWRTTIPGMDAETKANVFATLLKKIDPLVSHRDLVAFAHTETSEGFDLADILTGGGFGVNLPEATYGMGGLVLANLAKERVYKLLRERGSHWEKMEGQRRVGIFVDEAAGLVSATDVGFLKVGRGFGATCVFAVQNADAYVYKLGSQAAAETFLDNFASMISMESSDYTYQVLNHKLGNVRKQKWKGPSTAVNFVRSMRMLAESALLDPSHPGAKRAETLLRRGAGVFREHSDGAHGFAGHKHYSREPSVVDAVLKIDPIEQVEWVDAPLLERPEWSTYLSARGVAIAQVLRGEVKRRDVIHFESLREFPPELLEQAPAPKVESPSAEETTATADDLHHLNRKSSRHSLFDLDKGEPTAAETMAEATTSSLPADKVKP